MLATRWSKTRAAALVLGLASLQSIPALLGSAYAADSAATAPSEPIMGHPGMRHGFDPEKQAMRAEKMIDRTLDQVNATPEQRTKIKAIAKPAMSDMHALRMKLMQSKKLSADLLAAPVMDKAAIEKARVAQSAIEEQVSQRRTQALVDAAEVLDPTQRAKLKEMMGKHGGGHRWGAHR